jgi:hypothetical protein
MWNPAAAGATVEVRDHDAVVRQDELPRERSDTNDTKNGNSIKNR